MNDITKEILHMIRAVALEEAAITATKRALHYARMGADFAKVGGNEKALIADMQSTACHTVAVAIRALIDTPAETGTPVTLPYDVKIGGVTFRRGAKLETLINAAQRWYDQCCEQVKIEPEAKKQFLDSIAIPDPLSEEITPEELEAVKANLKEWGWGSTLAEPGYLEAAVAAFLEVRGGANANTSRPRNGTASAPLAFVCPARRYWKTQRQECV